MKKPLPMTRSGYPTPFSTLIPRLTRMVTVPEIMLGNDGGESSAVGGVGKPCSFIAAASALITARLPASEAAAKADS